MIGEGDTPENNMRANGVFFFDREICPKFYSLQFEDKGWWRAGEYEYRVEAVREIGRLKKFFPERKFRIVKVEYRIVGTSK